MKVRKIIAAVLAFALVVTAVPLENLSTVKAAETVTTNAGEEGFLLRNIYPDVDADKLVDGLKQANLEKIRKAKVSIETLQDRAFTNYTDWPWVAMKVNVDEGKAGTYTFEINLSTNGSITPTSKQLGVITNGVSNEAKFDGNSKAVATVSLLEGTNIIVFTTPIPNTNEVAEALSGTDYYTDAFKNAYPWFNFLSFTYDKSLDITAPSVDEVKNSVSTKIEAGYASGTTNYVTYDYMTNGFFQESDNATVNKDKVDVKQSLSDLKKYIGKSSIPYVQYTVEAPTDGNYMMQVGYNIRESAHTTSLEDNTLFAVLVNNKLYKIECGENSNNSKWLTSMLSVELVKGVNTIRTTYIPKNSDWAGTNAWMKQDFIMLDGRVKAVLPSKVSITAADTTKYTQNLYDNWGGVKQGYCGDSEKLYLETLETSDLPRIPYIALKVNAEKDGYYDVTVKSSPNTAYASTKPTQKIGVLVDGVVNARTFTVQSNDVIDASVYLKAGVHTLVFTPPMPLNEADIIGTDNCDWPWFDYKEIILSGGLKLAEDTAGNVIVPTKAEVSGLNRIEAENKTYVSYNGGYNGTWQKGASEINVASGAVYADQMQTYEQVSTYLDHRGTSYVQFAVNVPADGEYSFDLGIEANCAEEIDKDTTNVAILVNGKNYPAVVKTNKKGVQNITVSNITLEEGVNIIRCTAVSDAGKEITISYDYLDLPANITPVKVVDMPKASEPINAGNQNIVVSNNFSNITTTLGGSNRSEMTEDGTTIANLLSADVDRLTYAAFKVDADKTDYYDISIAIGDGGTPKTSKVGLIVDGEKCYPLTVSTSKIGATIKLSEGEHVLLFTTSIPVDESVPATYKWMDFNSFTLDTGLSAVSIYKTSGIEAEDSNYVSHYNLAKENIVDFTNKKIARGIIAKPQTDVLDNEIDLSDTNVFQFTYETKAKGSYELALNMMSQYKGDTAPLVIPSVTLNINGKTYFVKNTEWNKFETIKVNVDLKAGNNLISVIATSDMQQENVTLTYDWIEIAKQSDEDHFVAKASEIKAGDSTYVGYNQYKDNGDSLGGGTYGDIIWDKTSLETLEKADLTRVPHALLKVEAQEDGYYNISASVKTDDKLKSNKIALLVIGADKTKIYPVSVKAITSVQNIGKTLYLEKGTYYLLWTCPMPEKTLDKVEKTHYQWIDYYTFSLSEELVAKVVNEASYDEIGIEAEDEENVSKFIGTFKTGYVVGASSDQALKTTVSNEKLPETKADNTIKGYVDLAAYNVLQYTIDATSAGTYKVNVGLKVNKDATIAVIVNNKIYHQTLTANSEFTEASFDIALDAGVNVIRCITVGSDGTVYYDYIEAEDNALSFKTVANTKEWTTTQADDTTYVIPNLYKDTDASNPSGLGSATFGHIEWSKVSIETLLSVELGRVPYAAMKVQADKDGFYDVIVNTSANKSNTSGQFGLIVIGKDGKTAYPVTFKLVDGKQNIGASIYLEEGTYFLVVTSPMPLTKAEADALTTDADKRAAYRWADLNSFTLSVGLTTLEAGTVNTKALIEAEASELDKQYSDEEAEKTDIDYVTYYGDAEIQLYPNASDDLVVKVELFGTKLPDVEKVVSWSAYAEYQIKAEKTGKYNLNIGAVAQKNGDAENPIIAVVVNGKLYSVAMNKWNDIENLRISNVILNAGTNVMRCIAVGTGVDIYYDYFSFEGEGLEAVATNSETDETVFNAGDETKVSFQYFQDIGEVLGKMSAGHLRYHRPSLDTLNVGDLGYIPYVMFSVDAKTDGYYDITAMISTNTSSGTNHLGLILDGTTHVMVFDNTKTSAVRATVYLTQGRHVFAFTSPMPERASEVPDSKSDSIAYPWIDFNSFVLSSGLSVVPRSANIVEAEDSKYYHLLTVQAEGKEENASNDKVLGSAKIIRAKSIGLTLEDFTADQIRMVPYFSYTVEAPADGYYTIAVNMASDGRLPKSQIAMLVDGKISTIEYTRTDKTASGCNAMTMVYLTKGEHSVTFTTPLPANAVELANTDYSYRWMNFDRVVLYNGLKLAAKQKSPTNIEDLVRIEAEDVGLPNMTKVNQAAEGKDVKDGFVGSAKYRRAQTVAQIQKNGMDERTTPFVQYAINAKQAGTYTVYFEASYGIYKPTVQEMDATVAIEVDGKVSFHTVHCVKDKTNSSLIPVTMKLSKGDHVVRLSHLTGDSIKGEGYCWIDYNYIEVAAADSKNIAFVPTNGVVEAERSEAVTYVGNSSAGSSGGQCLGNADYKYVDESDVTFANLDVKNLGELSRVTYTVMAEEAGTYYLSVQFNGGVINYTFNELVEKGTIGFAVSVNEGEKQLVEFCPDAGTGSISRIIEVDLQEGENHIMVTTTLADYISGVSPRVEDEYRLYWIDHDAIRLTAGVSSADTEVEPYDVNETDIDHAQLSAEATRVIDMEEDSHEMNVVAIVTIAGSMLALAALFMILIFLKKKKKEEEQ